MWASGYFCLCVVSLLSPIVGGFCFRTTVVVIVGASPTHAPNPPHRSIFVQTDIAGRTLHLTLPPNLCPPLRRGQPISPQTGPKFGEHLGTKRTRTSSSLIPPGSDYLALPSHPDDYFFLPSTTAGPPRLHCPPFRGKKSPMDDARLPPSIPLRLQPRRPREWPNTLWAAHQQPENLACLDHLYRWESPLKLAKVAVVPIEVGDTSEKLANVFHQPSRRPFQGSEDRLLGTSVWTATGLSRTINFGMTTSTPREPCTLWVSSGDGFECAGMCATV
jgi:hypothetical protein